MSEHQKFKKMKFLVFYFLGLVASQSATEQSQRNELVRAFLDKCVKICYFRETLNNAKSEHDREEDGDQCAGLVKVL